MVFMTEQQKDLERLAAWDRYQDSRKTILALKSKLEGWRSLASRMWKYSIEGDSANAAAQSLLTKSHCGYVEMHPVSERIRPSLSSANPWSIIKTLRS